ncbi:hypothetical protein [Succinimonas amylolytica]|uniref:hypothetical protein n=1 Tax=Succinimonas amylolytica TaxID=83769 RepID=UPI000A03C175|nr:hypothetical protein [Succinimonas amylolytica]
MRKFLYITALLFGLMAAPSAFASAYVCAGPFCAVAPTPVPPVPVVYWHRPPPPPAPYYYHHHRGWHHAPPPPHYHHHHHHHHGYHHHGGPGPRWR